MAQGIAIAGTILVDTVKMIQGYPQKGMLTNILDQYNAVGGCVPNTAIDLAKIDPSLPIQVWGLVGDDANGRYVLGEMKRVGIDTSHVHAHPSAVTGSTDVMTEQSTGDRTFFHNKGANALFSAHDIQADHVDTAMCHLGYLMLLDTLDALDHEGRTGASKLLQALQARGVKTSIDMVSVQDGGDVQRVINALPYCNYVIINEIEAGSIAAIQPRHEDGTLNPPAIRSIMERIMAHGVKDKVVIHCPEYGFSLDKSGAFTMVPSMKLPPHYIKGSVGAGDAFCAGVLYSIYQGASDEALLSFASRVAASCLSMPDSVSGILPKEQLLSLHF